MALNTISGGERDGPRVYPFASMATSMVTSCSPRLSDGRAFDPATPVHSPHHSVNSSTSSRTPLHTLSLHEYRKLQNTPTSQSSTPPAKPLRRKAAASALKGLERATSLAPSPASNAPSVSRPLHFSRSAHQLAAYQPLPPSPPQFEQPLPDDSFLRSQSAEPRASGGPAFRYLASLGAETPQHANHRLSYWKPIKRLPKPRPSWTPAHILSAHPPAVSSVAPIQRTPALSAENVPSSGTHATPSTFSLSRFPRPPLLIDPSLSPPKDENAPSHVNTSFTTTAPATPPATPAVIHYRGASFDLVNPRDSLLFHDIVTPSRELDSTEYLPLRSSDEPLVAEEMSAHRRQLYTNFESAYNRIKNRDESPATPDPNTPLAPPPALLSPNSSAYSSPETSYEVDAAVPPLGVKKKTLDTRFSMKQLTPIKQLTRTFKEKLTKTPEPEEQELQVFRSPQTTSANGQFEGNYPRPLAQSYSTTPAPWEHPSRQPYQYGESVAQHESSLPVENSELSRQSGISMSLTSMVPDDHSTQVGRGFDPNASYVSNSLTARPYYEDMDSIYPSSSIYSFEGEDGPRGYPPSLHSKRFSRPPDRSMYDDNSENPFHNTNSIFSFSDTTRPSRPPTQEFPRRSQLRHVENTDTISKFIDQYDGDELANVSQTAATEDPQAGRASGFSQFDFGLRNDRNSNHSEASAGRGRRPTITQSPGSPPPHQAPLAPPFQYSRAPKAHDVQNSSEMFAGASSYGDTQQLLQSSQSTARGVNEASPSADNAAPLLGRAWERSSSYSQSDGLGGSKTPQEAHEHADQIFEKADTSNTNASDAIPAIWARRASGNLLRRKYSTVVEETESEKGDWETVGNDSRRERPSLDDESLANYSDDESDDVESFVYDQENSLPVLPSAPRELSPYRHPSPLPDHEHPFTSSPPNLKAAAKAPSSPERADTTFSSSGSQNRAHEPAVETIYVRPVPSRWTPPQANPYELSDKETQELLNSGPNEDILYNDARAPRRSGLSDGSNQDSLYNNPSTMDYSEPVTSPLHSGYNHFVMERDNTFAKFSTVGPKGNLTGTPHGTGMHEVGSSLADTSSPGVPFGSSPLSRQRPLGFAGFYASPGRTQSRTVIRSSGRNMPSFVPTPGYERNVSQESLSSLDSLRPIGCSVSDSRRQHHGRTAVAGQTRLREMVLASDASSHITHFSEMMRMDDAEDMSTNGTGTFHAHSSQHSRATLKKNPAKLDSPHILFPERELSAEDRSRREKLSWIFVGVMCLFPPILILFRYYGDEMVAWASNDRYGASPGVKRASTPLFCIANFIFVVLIVVPVVITQVPMGGEA